MSVAKKASAAPTLNVETWPIGRVTGYHRNAREHSSHQIDQIADSIRTFGWTSPLLVTPAGALIAGHGRLEAARWLGVTEVPVVILAGLSESQPRLLRIADNKLALNASWNLDLLTAELKERPAGLSLLRPRGADRGLRDRVRAADPRGGRRRCERCRRPWSGPRLAGCAR